MKKVLFLMVCMMTFMSCKMSMSGWDSNQIEPSDNVVTQTYKLQPFEKVEMICVGHVEIIQDESKDGTVELTAPDNYIELYKFESNNKALKIGFRKSNINITTKKVKIRVYTGDLIELRNSGAASISMDKLDTDRLEIVNSGVGSINISGIADDVEIINSGVGNIDAAKLKAMNVKADVSGVGSITCYASERIEGRVSGVGSLRYAGNPKNKDNKRSGVGSISEI